MDTLKSHEELEQTYERLLNKLPSRAPIFLPTDKIPLAQRIAGVEHVLRIYQTDLDAVYRPRLRALREQYKGRKRCFLIGNGPSLNKTDLSVLADEVTFATNGFFIKAQELDWTPTFYCVEDHLVAEDRAPWINTFKGPVKFFPAYLGYMFPPAEDTIFYNHRPRKSYPHGFDFSHEADRITYTGCTVTFSLMQLATYLGFEEIYLVGVDASYEIPADVETGKDYGVGVLDMKSDDPNHFDPNYFGKGFRWHDPQVGKMLEAYAEARRALEGTGQTIYNATVGGMLEVFPRRDFYDLFPQAIPPGTDPQALPHPRLLIFDMTATGNGSATGEVKAALLHDWPTGSVLQVASRGQALALVRRGEDGVWAETPATEAEVTATIESFRPELMLYRPLADRPALHRLALDEIRQRALPLVTWIMDDWPARLQATDPSAFAELDADLRWLLDRSSLRLSIGEAMSEAFEVRYGHRFVAFANGVDPRDWQQPHRHRKGKLLLRYAGGLAPDMNAASLQEVARAVAARRAQGQDVRLEISTNAYWSKVSGSLFDGLDGTQIDTENRSPAEYRKLLCDADVLLLAFNFDADSRRYIRYSIANKLPECLASGAAVLAYGPRGLATVDYLADAAVAEVVDQQESGALEAAIASLADPKKRKALAGPARKLAFERHNLPALRKGLTAALKTARETRVPVPLAAPVTPVSVTPVAVTPVPMMPVAPAVAAPATAELAPPVKPDLVDAHTKEVLAALNTSVRSLSEARRLCEDAERQLARCEHDLADLRPQHDDAMRRAELLAADLAETLRARDALQAEIDRVYASNSWRVTRPLRDIRRIIDTLRGRSA